MEARVMVDKRKSPKNQPDEFLLNNYKYFQEWHHWYDKAISLRQSALALYRIAKPELRRFEKARRTASKQLKDHPVAPIRYPHPDLLPTFALYGSALENAFKGILVSRDATLIGERKLSDKLKSHNLVTLAGHSDIVLSEREEYVLKWLTEVVIWKARYSVPTRAQAAHHFIHVLDDVTISSAMACMRELDAVFARAKSAMPRRRKRTKFDVLVRLTEEA
jgi:hypothetical protein